MLYILLPLITLSVVDSEKHSRSTLNSYILAKPINLDSIDFVTIVFIFLESSCVTISRELKLSITLDDGIYIAKAIDTEK